MKPDLYTKVLLTVIAASLLWLCTERYIYPAPAQAQSVHRGPQEVVIVGVGDVRFPPLKVRMPALPVEVYGATLVRTSSEPLSVTVDQPVDINRVEEPVDVNVTKQPVQVRIAPR